MIDLLKGDYPIFKLIKNSKQEILNKWEVLNYKQDDVICKYNEVYEYFYVLLKGSINIYHTSEKGKTYSQSVYYEGSYFGELEIFENLPYVCEIKAITDVMLIRLQKKYFNKWIQDDNDITIYLLKSLCKSSYMLSKKAIEDTLYSLKFRICDYLIKEYEERKKKKFKKFYISKDLLSQNFVVTRRSINRILKDLHDKDLINVDLDKIEILDIKELIKERESQRY
ncbi:Crp/Fnr family transcriptional regulator [Peptostreptococcaceae bacterium AGR-M142]